MESNICLICNASYKKESAASVSFEELSSRSFHSRKLYVNFVLRHVLELPSELLHNLIKSSSDLEELVNICLVCNEGYVRSCRNIFEELLEVRSRFNDAKLKLISAMKRSRFEVVLPSQQEDKDVRLDTQEKLLLDIYYQIRQFVETHEYEDQETSLGSPHIDGDLLDNAEVEVLQGDSNEVNEPLPDEVIPSENMDTDHVSETIKVEPVSPICSEDEEESEDGREEQPSEHESNYTTEEESCSTSEEDDQSDDEDWIAENELSAVTQKQKDSPEKKSKGRPRIHPVQPKKPKRAINCDQCSKVLTGPTKLRDHQIRVHKTNYHTCPHCDHKATTPASIRAHIKRNHSDDKSSLNDLKCPKCGKIITFKSNLKKHISYCGNENRETFQCEPCNRKYLSEDALQNHMGAVHGIKGDLRFKCSFEGCEKYFSKRYILQRHEASHKPPQFECSLCGEKFLRKGNYNLHMSQHETGGARRFQCDQCQAGFTRKDNLAAHVKTFHKSGGEDNKATSSKTKKIAVAPQRELKNYKCSECGLIVGWKNKRILVRHIEKVHNGNASVINVDENGSVIQTVKRHQCEYCDRKFTKMSYYHNHLGRDHGIQEHLKFRCSFEGCGKAFGLNMHLALHKKKHRNNQIKCEKCEEHFLNKGYLQAHMKKVHKKSKGKTKKFQKPVRCPICEALFPNRNNLQSHIAIVHEKRYECCCDMCGKILTRRCYLKIHKRNVHKIGPIPKFPCAAEGCGRSFLTKREMKYHTLYKHEGIRLFQCEQCGQSLISPQKLKKHILAMHTNRESKPFQCDQCGKGFAIKDYLNVHLKTHQPK